MNINSLFKKQKELDEHIVKEKGLEGQDLLKKKTVALICELYECVNEAKFFKFWKENPKPRTKNVVMKECEDCDGTGSNLMSFMGDDRCSNCDGKGTDGIAYIKNPLLEEYADVIHFSLSIANDLNYTEHTYTPIKDMDLNELVIGITNMASMIPETRYNSRHLSLFFNHIIKLGYQLGFTEDDVLNAYDDKNKENHNRQQNGY